MAKAKKKSGSAKSAGGGGGASQGLDVTNLKFIGAAFDVAIADLMVIKVNAKNPRKVQTKINKLKKLKTATSRECPQSWYPRFDLR